MLNELGPAEECDSEKRLLLPRAGMGGPTVLKIRSVEPFLLRVPISAGSTSGSAHTGAHRSVAGTAMLSEAAMSSNAKPC